MNRFRWSFFLLYVLGCPTLSSGQYQGERPFSFPSNEPYNPVMKGVKVMLIREVPPYPRGEILYERQDTSYLATIDQDGYPHTGYYYEGGACKEKFVSEYYQGKLTTFRHFSYRMRQIDDGPYFLDTTREVSRHTRTYPTKGTMIEREYRRCDSSLSLHQELRYAYDGSGRVVSKTSRHFREICDSESVAKYDSIIFSYTADAILSEKYTQGEIPLSDKFMITLNSRGNILQYDGAVKEVYKYNQKGRITEYRKFMNNPYDEEYRRLNSNSLRWLADKIVWTYTAEGWIKSETYFEQGTPTLKFMYEYIR